MCDRNAQIARETKYRLINFALRDIELQQKAIAVRHVELRGHIADLMRFDAQDNPEPLHTKPPIESELHPISVHGEHDGWGK